MDDAREAKNDAKKSSEWNPTDYQETTDSGRIGQIAWTSASNHQPIATVPPGTVGNLDIPKIPLEPFYGTMGTAPELEAISTLAPGWYGGNMEAPDACPGNIIYFPVNVPGGLLHLGDGHAAQGDGEVSGRSRSGDSTPP